MRTVIADPETGKTYEIEIDYRAADDAPGCVARRWEWMDTWLVLVWVLLPVGMWLTIGVVGYHVIRSLFGEG